MTSRDFCYWLQGYFELSEAGGGHQVTLEQLQKQFQVAKNHLAMVFKHEIDPSHGNAEHQKKLSEAHQGKSPLIQALEGSITSSGTGSVFNC